MGFLAILINFAARLMVASNCFFAKPFAARLAALGRDGKVLAIGMASRRIEACISFGKSTKTGPGLPLVAISKASFIRKGNSATEKCQSSQTYFICD